MDLNPEEIKRLQLLADPELYEKYCEVKEQLQNARHLVEEKEAKITELENQKQSLKLRHNEAMEAYNSKVDAYQREFTNKLENLMGEKQVLKRLGLELDLEAKDGATKLVHARCVIRELEIDILKFQYRLERSHVQIANDKAYNKQLKASNRLLKKEIKMITAQRDALHKSSLALIDYLNAASSASKSINKEFLSNKSSKAALEKQTDILKSNILEQANKIVQLQQQNKEFQLNIDTLKTQEQQNIQRFEKLSKEYENLKAHSELEKSKYEKCVEELKNKCKSHSKQLNQLERKEAEKQQEKITEEIATLHKQVEELCQKKKETETEMLNLKNDSELQKSRLAKQELKLLLAEKELKVQKLKQKIDIVSMKGKADAAVSGQDIEEFSNVEVDEGQGQHIGSNKRTRNRVETGQITSNETNNASERTKRIKTVDSDVPPVTNEEENKSHDEAQAVREKIQPQPPLRRSGRRTRKLLDVEKEKIEADENTQTQDGAARRKAKWAGKASKKGGTLFSAFIDKRNFSVPKLKQK